MVVPVVVETAPVRCAKVDPRTKEVFSEHNLAKSLARPAPRACPDGKMAVCESDARAWIDTLEAAVKDQHASGKILIKDLNACRGGPPPKGRRVKTVPVQTS